MNRWPRTIRCCALVVGAVVLAGPAEADRHPIVLQDTTYRSVSEFGPDTLLIRELLFDGPLLSAQIDDSSGDLLVAFRETHFVKHSNSLVEPDVALNRLVAYDLHAHRVMWDKISEFLPVTAQGNRAVLLKGVGQYSLIRVEDGEEQARITGTPLVWADRVAMRVTDSMISGWDLESGNDLWTVDREIDGDIEDVMRRDSVAYLVANGIQKIDLHGGSPWSYSVRASRGGLYSNQEGGTVHVSSMYGGSRATNLTALPLISDSVVFFAAETTVVKLDAGSGRVRWSRNLTRPKGFSLKQRALGLPSAPEFLGHLVLRDAGRNVLVASLGWASGPKYNLMADPPTVALLAKSDGHVVARVQVPGATFLNGALSTPLGNYVVSSDRVVALDDSLRVRATFVAPTDVRPLGQFIEVGDAIVLTTGPGIVALSSDSLQVLWSRRCGRMLAIDRNIDDLDARYCVTTQGLIRLDRRAGLRPSAYYPLRGTWAELREGWMVIGAGARVRVATLLAHRPAPRVD